SRESSGARHHRAAGNALVPEEEAGNGAPSAVSRVPTVSVRLDAVPHSRRLPKMPLECGDAQLSRRHPRLDFPPFLEIPTFRGHRRITVRRLFTCFRGPVAQGRRSRVGGGFRWDGIIATPPQRGGPPEPPEAASSPSRGGAHDLGAE